MPLAKSALKSALQSLAENPPSTAAECAAQWASGMTAYAVAIVPPSTTVAAAASALQAALASAFSPPDASGAMETAFLTFATTVASGMSPAFVGVPPVNPVGFSAQFAASKPDTAADGADAFADLIDTWMKTGQASPASPPGPPSAWV